MRIFSASTSPKPIALPGMASSSIFLSETRWSMAVTRMMPPGSAICCIPWSFPLVNVVMAKTP